MGDKTWADSYKLVAADLRDSAGLEDALATAGVDFAAPTILLAECVLVYMEPAESAALLQVFQHPPSSRDCCCT